MIDDRINDKKSIKFHVKEFLESIKSELNGKKVIDIPAGSGSTTEVLLELVGGGGVLRRMTFSLNILW